MKDILNLLKIEFQKNLKYYLFLIILIILIISSFLLTNYTYKEDLKGRDFHYYVHSEEEWLKNYKISKKIYEENKTIENEYIYERHKINIEILKMINDYDIKYKDDFRFISLHELYGVRIDLLLIEYIEKGYKVESSNINALGSYENLKKEEEKLLNKINSKYYEEEILIKEELVKQLENASNENEKKKLEESIKLSDYIINEKIESNMDPFVTQIKSLKSVLNSKYFIPLTIYEFQEDEYYSKVYSDYDTYLEENITLQKKIEEYSNLVWYSLNNKIVLNEDDVLTYKMPFNSKTIFNEIYFLGIVILLILIIFYSGIIANEFNNKTIYILATKVSRWKIIISKLLFLILTFLLFYIISYIIMLSIVYFNYNINDLFHNELIIHNNNILEINYLKMVFINLLEHSLIIILILTILVLISSFIKNTSIIITFMLSLTVLFCLVPLLGEVDLKILPLLPFSYLNYAIYLKGIKILFLTQSELFIINIILIVLIVIFNIWIINKKDFDV